MACFNTYGRRVIRVIAFLLFASVFGCATEETGFHPVWPPAPAETRIRHIVDIRRGSDLAKPGFFDNLVELISGGGSLSLLRPHGAAVDDGKRLYVTDQERQAVIVFDFKSPKAGMISRIGETFFVSPVCVAVCGDLIAVSDSALKTVVLMTPGGEFRRALQKPEGFDRPTGLAYDPVRRRLYVVDTLANEICMFDLKSGKLVGRFGSSGTGHGRFNFPTHIFRDRTGRIYVTDSLNFRVQVFGPDGEYAFQIGRLGDASGYLAVPKGVCVDSEGHIYIVDSYFSTVQIFDRRGNFLLAVGQPGEESGSFQVPSGLAIDEKDRIYVCDSCNGRVQILQYIRGMKKDEDNREKEIADEGAMDCR